MRLTALLPVAAASALCVWGQDPADVVGEGEFPGLQLLPEGSVVRGISLPRYENHRVAAMVMADELQVATRSVVLLRNIRSELYDEGGHVTSVTCGDARYDFSRAGVSTDKPAKVKDPRFSAAGTGVVFSTRSRKGMLMGPVRTTFVSSAFKAAGK